MFKKIIAASFILSALSACGGGGGGGGSQEPTVSQSRYSQIPTKTVNATFNSNGSVSGMSSVTDRASGQVALSYDANSQLYEIQYDKGDSNTLMFSTNSGDTINVLNLNEGTIIAAYNSDRSKQILVFTDNNNVSMGTAYEKTGNTGYASVGHGGNETTIDPSTVVNSATYNGVLSGMLAETGFTPIYTVGSVSANANFNNRTMVVTASGVRGLTLDGTDLGAYSGQNFSTTLTDANSDNTFEGSVTDNEGKTGTLDATLYGGSAEALAGTGHLANGTNTRVHMFTIGANR